MVHLRCKTPMGLLHSKPMLTELLKPILKHTEHQLHLSFRPTELLRLPQPTMLPRLLPLIRLLLLPTEPQLPNTLHPEPNTLLLNTLLPQKPTELPKNTMHLPLATLPLLNRILIYLTYLPSPATCLSSFLSLLL